MRNFCHIAVIRVRGLMSKKVIYWVIPVGHRNAYFVVYIEYFAVIVLVETHKELSSARSLVNSVKNFASTSRILPS